MPRQIIETGPRIAVEGRGFLGEFEVVAAVGAGHVVGQHGAEWLVLVIDLGGADDVTLTGKKCRHPPDRAGDLVDLRIQQNTRIAPAAAGRNRCRRIGPVGVAMSANSSLMIIWLVLPSAERDLTLRSSFRRMRRERWPGKFGFPLG